MVNEKTIRLWGAQAACRRALKKIQDLLNGDLSKVPKGTIAGMYNIIDVDIPKTTREAKQLASQMNRFLQAVQDAL